MTERGQLVAWRSLLDSVAGSALEAIEACEQAAREIEAVRLRALALLEATGDAAVSHVWDDRAGVVRRQERSADLAAARRSGIAQVATRLRCSEGQVAAAWDRSRVAVREHPGLVDALARGEISARHLEVIVDESAAVPSAHRQGFADGLVQSAATRTPAQLRAHARQRRELTHPEAMSVRHRQARATRHVALEPGRDGMSWLTAHLPTVAAAAVYDRVTAAAVASQGPDEPRTLAQLRADALVDYCLAEAPLPGVALAGPRVVPPLPAGSEVVAVRDEDRSAAALGRTPAQRRDEVAAAFAAADDALAVASTACDADIYGVRAALAVTLPHTLLVEAAGRGDSAEEGAHRSGSPPRAGRSEAPHAARPTVAPELVGHGPVDDDTATMLLAAAPSLRRLLTDPHTGVALDMSRETYAVPSPLRAFLRMRDQTCRFPGCRRAAARCDVDHVEAWVDGGATDAANLAHLCRAHHRLKHLSGWTCDSVAEQGRGSTQEGSGDPAGSDPGDDSAGPAPGPDGAGGRLRPSTLRWTDPHGHVTETQAVLGGTTLTDIPPF